MLLAARMVLTPPTRRRELVEVLYYDADARTVTLSAVAEAIIPGDYSFWYTGDTGHAQLGEITERAAGTVTRRVLAVEGASIARAQRGRFSGWFYLSPADLGFEYSDVTIETDLGPAPAWLIPAARPSGKWVIQVHGRAGGRQEALRAVPVFRNEGYTSLLISYRNDDDAPQATDGRYALGDTEWRDVEAALQFAVENGATDILLMGWSMGGAIALQAATRSQFAPYLRGLVLESPVIDWVEALNHQGKTRGIPPIMRRGILCIICTGWARRLTMRGEAVNLRRMDFVRRAAELDLPILLMHSAADAFVPITASGALARARPDIVTFEKFDGAGHTKLWNHDKDRFNTAIELWLAGLVLGPRRR